MESNLCYFVFFLLYSLSLVSSRYVFPDHYFINCGSNSDETFTGHKFVGDVKPTSFKVSGGRVATENKNRNTHSIYQTARVFRKKSWYELDADQTNTFVMVRLHFSQFSSNEFDYKDAKFDVSVSGYSVLSNYSVGNTTVREEFIIRIQSKQSFRIMFTASQGSSVAFVNAIEAFTTPSNLFGDHVTLPLIPIHRINVGGKTIDVEGDTLRRKWVPDDSFIFNNESAKPHEGQITYQPGGATQFDAPDIVYKTAKQLNINSSRNTTLFNNITWNFPVTNNHTYLVRAHFCNIINIGLINQNDAFDFFIYNNHKEPIQINQPLAAPFYKDFVVNSSDSRFVNISIRKIIGNDQTPFLNGLEIMKCLKDSGRVDEMKVEKKNKKSVYIVVGCVIGGVAFVSALLLGFFIRSKHHKVKQVAGAKSESHAMPSYGEDLSVSLNFDSTNSHHSPIPNLNLGLRIPFDIILQATNNFDPELMIGKGGFGKVYKGTFLDGKKVAVKRGEIGNSQGRPEFVTEIMVLSKIRYRHLVSLVGYCDEKSEMILVYEFMEKGTLQDHLYNSKKDQLIKLPWKQRLEICISAAQGLHYLHTGADGVIIHRDVKSTNILLDEDYVAKVADFGISRTDNVDENQTLEIKGSFGYIDPEYISCLELTVKSDVYAFGVVLLEVLCARPALDTTLPEKEITLAYWATELIRNGEIEKIIDPFLVGTISTKSLRKFLDVVERCLKHTGKERPSMNEELWDLEYAMRLQQNVTVREPHDDSTMNTSLQLPMSKLQWLPSISMDDSEVNHSSILCYSSESQVLTQLKIDEA